MLKTHGLLHFSLPVTDLDRSRKFYEGVLGMKVVEQSPRMVFLQTGDDFFDFGERQRAAEVRLGENYAGASRLQSEAG
jgi:catechol 2,3-dioxygenase-like lactoylglutathione lyase family enzyme